jgi:hypothetical protein
VIAILIPIVSGFILPFPPARPTMEETYFREHRSDFEAVVSLAREDALEPSTDVCRGRYFAPAQLSHVSKTCIIIYGRNNYFSVVFYPIDDSYEVVYSDKVTGNPCFDGTVIALLDEHWFVCKADWL